MNRNLVNDVLYNRIQYRTKNLVEIKDDEIFTTNNQLNLMIMEEVNKIANLDPMLSAYKLYLCGHYNVVKEKRTIIFRIILEEMQVVADGLFGYVAKNLFFCSYRERNILNEIEILSYDLDFDKENLFEIVLD